MPLKNQKAGMSSFGNRKGNSGPDTKTLARVVEAGRPGKTFLVAVKPLVALFKKVHLIMRNTRFSSRFSIIGRKII